MHKKKTHRRGGAVLLLQVLGASNEGLLLRRAALEVRQSRSVGARDDTAATGTAFHAFELDTTAAAAAAAAAAAMNAQHGAGALRAVRSGVVATAVLLLGATDALARHFLRLLLRFSLLCFEETDETVTMG